MNKSGKLLTIKGTKRTTKQKSERPVCKRRKLKSNKIYVKADKKTTANSKSPELMNKIHEGENLITTNDMNIEKEADDTEVLSKKEASPNNIQSKEETSPNNVQSKEETSPNNVQSKEETCPNKELSENDAITIKVQSKKERGAIKARSKTGSLSTNHYEVIAKNMEVIAMLNETIAIVVKECEEQLQHSQ